MTQSGWRDVSPVRPVAGYIGGKRNLARRLVERIERTPHDTYAEAFVGMGGVFFRRARVPRAEIVNDAGRDVATLFRVLQRHYVAFLDMLRFQLTVRAEFERLSKVDPATLTDLERAARFLYLQRTAFGGKVVGRNFGVDPASPGGFDPTRLQPMLEAVHTRLAGVTIECLDFEPFLVRYDRPGTLFFLDPPYRGSESAYGASLFGPGDHARLVAVLERLAGRFLLTMNDTAETRAIYGRFACEPIETTYTLASGTPTKAREMIVSGGC